MDLLRFIKMHGLGNDFVIIDRREHLRAITEAQVRWIADRRKGVGCDQMIILDRPLSPVADVFMHIHNADGGRAGACGNATRCVALLLMRQKNLRELTIETDAGLLACKRKEGDLVSIDMSRPKTRWNEIPLADTVDTRHLPLSVGPLRDGHAINVGNPHVVFFVDDVEGVDLATWGPLIERDSLFPEGINAEVVQVLARDRLRMRVWERGAGITPACGSGACAVAVAAFERGLTDRTVIIVVDGGELAIEIDRGGRVEMTGPAATVFTGILDPSIVS